MDINDVVQSCIYHRKYRRSIYKKYISSGIDYFHDNYEGIIREELLFACLKESCHDRYMNVLVIEFMRFSDESSVSARVFEQIRAQHQSFRKTSIHTLSHCQLSLFQNMMLFSISQEIELFDSILCVLIRSPEFSNHDVQMFLELAKGIDPSVIQYFIENSTDDRTNPLVIIKMNFIREHLLQVTHSALRNDC